MVVRSQIHASSLSFDPVFSYSPSGITALSDAPFTKVILRHIHKPLDTCGEILDAHEQLPRPDIDATVLEKILKGRDRRSGGRK